jgi:chromatin remodeling complex protein RSC6
MCITDNMVKSAPSSSTPVASASASSAAPAVAAAPAAAAAAPAAKVAKPKAASKASSEAAAAAAPAVAPATPVVEGEAVAEVEGSVSAALYVSVLSKLQGAQSLITSIRSEVNELKRQHARELRVANKANKRRKTNANRAPSGFVKPTLISNELAAFLGRPEGSVLARTEVTREVNAYIRSQMLQDKDNGRKINPDAKLLKLLKLKKGEELTYFNLQKFMAVHFAKTVPAVAAAGGAVKA